MRAGQLAFVGEAYFGVCVIGISTFNGVPQLHAFLARAAIEPVPEAQGPPRRSETEMLVRGSYRFTRHPGNLAPIGVFVLSPTMTVNRATLGTLTTIYCVLGSLHEEHRLRGVYGAAYERYRDQAPFLIPFSCRKRPRMT